MQRSGASTTLMGILFRLQRADTRAVKVVSLSGVDGRRTSCTLEIFSCGSYKDGINDTVDVWSTKTEEVVVLELVFVPCYAAVVNLGL